MTRRIEKLFYRFVMRLFALTEEKVPECGCVQCRRERSKEAAR